MIARTMTPTLALGLLLITGCGSTASSPAPPASSSGSVTPAPPPATPSTPGTTLPSTAASPAGGQGVAVGPDGLPIFVDYILPDAYPLDAIALPPGEIEEYGNGYVGGAGSYWKFTILTGPEVDLYNAADSLKEDGFECVFLESEQTGSLATHDCHRDHIYINMTVGALLGYIDYSVSLD